MRILFPDSSAFAMNTLYELTEEMARFKQSLHDPRELRAYVKNIAMLAQKMNLPFKTLTILYYLAHADIYTLELDDCREKIRAFSEILTSSSSRTIASLNQKTKKDVKIDDLALELDAVHLDAPLSPIISACLVRTPPVERKILREVMLDAPHTQSSTGSPTFTSTGFKMPPFLKHSEDCSCFCCTSIEYQVFILKEVYLQGVLNINKKQVKLAVGFFDGALKICKIFSDRQRSLIKKIRKIVPFDPIHNPLKKMIDIYYLILLEYGNIYLRANDLINAEWSNSGLIKKLKNSYIEFPYIYEEVQLQYLNVCSLKIALESKPNKTKAVTETLEEPSNNHELSHTPENKESVVIITPMPDQNENDNMHVKKIRRRIPFNFSDSDSDGDKIATKQKGRKVPLKKAGSSDVFQIYGTLSSKSVKGKKKQPKVPVPKIGIVDASDTESKELLNIATFNIDLDDTAPRSNGIDSNKVTSKSQDLLPTTVLPQKIKQSTKKRQPADRQRGNSVQDQEVNKEVVKVERNLMPDLENCIDVVGSLRRSKRNARL